MKSSAQGAYTSIFAAISPALDGYSGAYLEECSIAQPSALAESDKLAKELWDRSLKITGIRAFGQAL